MSWYMNNMKGRKPKNRLPEEERQDAFAKLDELTNAHKEATVAACMGVSVVHLRRWLRRDVGLDAVNYRKLRRLHAEMGVAR